MFISDRGKKGTGGKDIYFIHNKGHKWSKPMLAGDSLNSEYDEESVCYSRGGDTLWFSSMGHNTLGGYDIFYSVRNPKGGWMKPVNAGYPLNTAWDDMFYVPSPLNDSIFFFSSNRGGGLGGLDIYTGRRLPAAKHAYLQPPQHDTVTVKDTAALSLKKPPVLAKTDSVPSVRPDSAAIKDTTTIKKQPVAIIQSAESRIDNTYTEQISEGELLSERSFARDPDDTEMQIRRRSS